MACLVRGGGQQCCMRVACLCLLVLILPPGLQAGQASSLGDAVRDQYVEEISAERAAQVQDSGSLQLLDDYSRYLDEPALRAAADRPSAFVLVMPDGGLYLRITVFHAGTPAQVEDALQRVAPRPRALCSSTSEAIPAAC